MLASIIPVKFTIPFANSAGGGFRRTIPVASQIPITPGAASFTDGFPPLNFDPVASGGIPPFGQDVNGIHYETTAWLQWLAAGGGLVPYDATFQAAIGGYPNGALVKSVTIPTRIWQSLADNNGNNPDTGGSGWISITAGRLLGVQVFAAIGTATYTSTAGAGSIIVEGQAGGGAGGGMGAVGAGNAGAGVPGGAGAYGVSRYTTGFTGGITVTVGAGGLGFAGSPGQDGTLSEFAISGTPLICPGGKGGGISAAVAVPITGGQANPVTPTGANLISGPSDCGTISLVMPGNVSFAQGGAGGRTIFGAGGTGSTVNANGSDAGAGAFGAGGGGTAVENTTGNVRGGNGAPGIVRVWEYSA